MSSNDLSSFRADFPILDQEVHGKPLIYFDNGATTQKPRQVLQALQRYYEQDNSNVHRGIHELSSRATEQFEAARQRVATFIHAASSQEILFTQGTTQSINLVARAWGDTFIQAGDTILITELEHHSNLVPWQLLAERRGAQLRYLPIKGDSGEVDLSDFKDKLTGVKLLAFTHISNAMGVETPAKTICEMAREQGVVTLVDAAQSIGHQPLDVQELGCDFLAASAHKMCGPTGIGFLYGRQELLEAMPPYQAGGEMIETVQYDHSTWNELPYKFEAGTPHIEGAIGLHAAIDYLDSIGRDRIKAHDEGLGKYACEQLASLKGIRILGPPPGQNRAGLVSFAHATIHSQDICTLADEAGIALRGGHHCTMPLHHKLGLSATTRASFYFYNTREEVDRLIEVVARLIRVLGD